jgi:hypothetical protein
LTSFDVRYSLQKRSQRSLNAGYLQGDVFDAPSLRVIVGLRTECSVVPNGGKLLAQAIDCVDHVTLIRDHSADPSALRPTANAANGEGGRGCRSYNGHNGGMGDFHDEIPFEMSAALLGPTKHACVKSANGLI